jgi:crossover junction endodeoxyribonuclease RuvC
VFEYAPREIKLAVVGTGSASKQQVQHMVVSLLQLDGAPATDAADALAAAICHGHRSRMRARLSNEDLIASLR